MATNYRYAGLRAVGSGVGSVVVADAVWPEIIERTTVDQLRALLFDPTRQTNRVARKYLLTGLMVCGRCGAAMVARPRAGRIDPVEGGSQRRYACVVEPGRKGCGRNSIQARELEDHLGDVAVKRFAQLAAAGAFAPKTTRADDDISAELAIIDRKLAVLGDDWGKDKISDAAFHAATAALVERRATVSAQVRRLVDRTPALIVDYAAHPKRLGADWATMEFDRKRTVLRAVLDTVTITAPAGYSRGFDSGRVSVPAWASTSDAQGF